MNNTLRTALLALSTLALPSQAAVFKIDLGPGLFTPTERGNSNTTYLGWDTFDKDPTTGAPGNTSDGVISDSTPDIGTGTGSIFTTNGEDHISSSLNYYSSSGSVAETINFNTDGTPGSGFTTIIAQGITSFGPFGSTIQFGDILGITAVLVQATNTATNKGQFWAKWEVPSNQLSYSFDISTPSSSFVSFDKFTVDTIWSDTGFSADTAVIPEPSSLLLSAAGVIGVLLVRRRL